MDVKIDRFDGMSNVSFSSDANLTLLVGDNGIGKTFLLEAYSRLNNYFLDEFSDNYFINILKKFSKNKIIEENPRDIERGDFSRSYKVTLNSEEKNIASINDIIIRDVKEKQKKLSNIVSKDIFFGSQEVGEFYIDGHKNVTLDEEDFIFDVSFSVPDEVKIDNEVHIIKSIEEQNDSNYSHYTIRIDSENYGIMTRRYSENVEEIRKDIEEYKTENFEPLNDMVMRVLGQKLRDNFINNYNLNAITYIPSERVISMSSTLEKILGEENFGDLRYSEKIFMRQYTEAKEQMGYRTNSLREIKYSKEYIEILGGVPNFNSDGEIISVKDKLGNIVTRSLFSTKQNKLSPFFILEEWGRTITSSNRKNSLPRSALQLNIVEEPEAHLSLKGIIQMAKYIYKLAQTRKMIVSTHSDVLIAEINNLYMTDKNKIQINGYEILEKEEHKIFKNLEVTQFGYNSRFIADQLEILLNETEIAQNSTKED